MRRSHPDYEWLKSREKADHVVLAIKDTKARAFKRDSNILLKVLKASVYRMILGQVVSTQGPLVYLQGKPEDIVSYLKRGLCHQRYPKVGQIIKEDIVIRKGPTSLKLGGNLGLFQGLVKVRPSRGFIDLVDDLHIKAGTKITQEVARLLRGMRVSIKEDRSQLVGAYLGGKDVSAYKVLLTPLTPQPDRRLERILGGNKSISQAIIGQPLINNPYFNKDL